ncbi:hypothetical protein LZC95_38090 [Pendulispora brunnea]|uniref:Uncharacterized protein n=1 Tax=Pendulispora brunnea TaxID=2905690 RepID=A0ABZ2K2E5_9BACT
MRSSFRIFAWLAFAVFTVSTVAPLARAQEESEPVVLVYRAPRTCPTEAAFLEEVRQRTTRLRAPRGAEAFRRFTVDIRVTRAETRGRLSIRDTDGAEAVRTVAGENCGEVGAALALAVAIAVDPTVSLGPAPEGGPAHSPFANRESRIANAPRPPSPPPAARPVPPAPKVVRRFRAALAMEGVVATGVAPDALWGAGLAATWTAPLTFEPSLRTTIAYLTGAREAIDAAEAHFARWTAGLEGCALRVRLGSVSLFPCAKLEIGALRAEGQKIARATSEVRPWVAVGPSARVRWLVPGQRLFVEAGAAAMLPLTRDRFFFQPNITIHRAAVLGAEASLALGLEW